MLTNEDIVSYIREKYPNVSNTTVAIDSSRAPFNELIKRLFLDGYKIIASSRVEADIDQLNRILYNMSGSKFRYRYAPFNNIYKEPTTVLVVTETFNGDSQYAKEIIRVTKAESKGDLEPVNEGEISEMPVKRMGRPKSKP